MWLVISGAIGIQVNFKTKTPYVAPTSLQLARIGTQSNYVIGKWTRNTDMHIPKIHVVIVRW